VLVVSLVAIGLAFDRSSNILSLVGNAWAGFGAAFGPIILLSLYWRGLTRDGALAGHDCRGGYGVFWLYAPIEIDGKSLSDIHLRDRAGLRAQWYIAAIVVSVVGRDVLPHVAHRFGEMEKAMDAD
jgi:Na+/proline symporter